MHLVSDGQLLVFVAGWYGSGANVQIANLDWTGQLLLDRILRWFRRYRLHHVCGLLLELYVVRVAWL